MDTLYAVLGETLELCLEAAEWGIDEAKRLKKNEQARIKVTRIINNLKKEQNEADDVTDCQS